MCLHSLYGAISESMSNFNNTCVSKIGSGVLCYRARTAVEHIQNKISLQEGDEIFQGLHWTEDNVRYKI